MEDASLKGRPRYCATWFGSELTTTVKWVQGKIAGLKYWFMQRCCSLDECCKKQVWKVFKRCQAEGADVTALFALNGLSFCQIRNG